jgi:hypothetical protein
VQVAEPLFYCNSFAGESADCRNQLHRRKQLSVGTSCLSETVDWRKQLTAGGWQPESVDYRKQLTTEGGRLPEAADFRNQTPWLVVRAKCKNYLNAGILYLPKESEMLSSFFIKIFF